MASYIENAIHAFEELSEKLDPMKDAEIWLRNVSLLNLCGAIEILETEVSRIRNVFSQVE